MDNKCIFCLIVAKQSTADIYYEDEVSLAFPTQNPIVKGHVMVIPKMHSTNLLDIDPTVLVSLATSTQSVAKKVMVDFGANSFNLLMANGPDAQQHVGHFHWHIVPRHAGDGLDLWLRQGH